MQNHRQSRVSSRRDGSIIIAAAAVAAVSTGAYGQTVVTWVGTTGAYTNSANWNPAVTPTSAANHFLAINNGGTAQVPAGGEGTWLNLGLQPGDTGHLQITGGLLTLGELRVGGRETIPDFLGGSTPNGGGTGSVLHTGGTLSVTYASADPIAPIQSLYVGDAGLSSGNSAVGSYTITNDAVLVSGIANDDSIVVGTGAGTQGAFTQQGASTVTSAGFVAVGRRGATATYAMTGGTLNVGSPDLAAVSGMSLWIADAANADATDVVPGTRGTFTQSGNTTVNVKGGVEIGRRGGTGSYSISSGALNVTGQIIIAGNGGSAVPSLLSGTGTFNVSGSADVNVGGNLNVGLSSSAIANTAQATLSMTGGTIDLTAANAIFAIGNGRATTGTVDLSAGSITMTQSGTSLIDLGRNNGTGLLLVRGTGSLTARQITVNSTSVAGATREVRIEGGTVDVGLITFGSVASEATRSLNISGGNVHIGSLVTGNPSGVGSAVTHVSNNAAPVIDSLEFFSNSTFKTSSNLTLASLTTTTMPNYRFGNATIDTAAGTTFTINGPGNFGAGAARTLTKVGGGTLAINAPQNYVANSAITVNQGALNLNSPTTDGNLTINALANVNFAANQSLNALNVTGGTTTLAASGSRNLAVNSLSISGGGGAVDLTDNSLTVPSANTPVSTVVGYLNSAFAGGAWNGPGLTSSTARDRADNATGLGYSDDGTTVTVLYTWAGDLNLDKRVNGDDYSLVDKHVATNGMNSAGLWGNGDVNYDGVVNSGDYFLIDTSFGVSNGGALSADFLAAREVQFGSHYVTQLVAAVPEPASVGVIAAAAVAGLTARRRRSAR